MTSKPAREESNASPLLVSSELRSNVDRALVNRALADADPDHSSSMTPNDQRELVIVLGCVALVVVAVVALHGAGFDPGK